MLEKFFESFRENIIGINQEFTTPYGEQKLIYLDWIASGRLYKPIEEKIINDFGPYVGNTHSESSVTGRSMTAAYHEAQKIIKKHVNASKEDVIIAAGSGMTTVINKFQRILGLTAPEQLKSFISLPDRLRPVVFLTHREHHSNQTTWLETIADVVVVEPDELGYVDPRNLEAVIKKYSDRKLKIGSFSACSNVTGIKSPYHKLAKIMHANGGFCFVDFAASAPYVTIDMHPEDPLEKLDAIFFSPHKFLGGPGAPGILIFDSKLYERKTPDQPGGGTVDWTNPWGQHKYISNIEIREDGGTPAFLQTIKTALAIKLKEKMKVENIEAREKELVKLAFEKLEKLPRMNILAEHIRDRIGAISFYLDGIHYNLVVKLLNDRFGIQTRGGCSCAGTYGHYLLHVSPDQSQRITEKINHGDLSEKPGWIRFSIHPTTTEAELNYFAFALEEIINKFEEWKNDYLYDLHTNEFRHLRENNFDLRINDWYLF